MTESRTRMLAGGVVVVLAVTAVWRFWWNPRQELHRTGPPVAAPAAHGHSHADPHGSQAAQSLTLSDEARQNLDLQISKIAATDYWKSLTVPGEVIEEPGHCEQRITTSLDGFVRKIHILKGQTVFPGDALFDLQLAGGPLADVQANLLRTVQNLELVQAELGRIKPLADQGTIPVRTLLEKQFEQKRLEIQRHTEREELLIRGLSEDQVAGIIESKTLLREFTVRVPKTVHDESKAPADADRATPDDGSPVQPAGLTDYTDHVHQTVYTVEHIEVVQGEMVRSGDRLC